MDLVTTTVEQDTTYITLSQPQRGNALSWQMHRELGMSIDRASNDGNIRFIVIRGADGTFSSGGDLRQIATGLPDGYVEDYWRRMRETVMRIADLDKVVVSAIAGAAVGAGAALAFASDITIAEENAKFRVNFTHLGLVPDGGLTASMVRAVGAARAREMILTGRWISSVEAQEVGLVARLCPDGGLKEAIETLLNELRKSPRGALALTKNLIAVAQTADFGTVTRLEGVHQQSAASDDTYKTKAQIILGQL